MIRVLIAEDSSTVRELLIAALTEDPKIQLAGIATTGVEALEMTQRLRPDVVTMDINMPEMDGLEATKEIMVRAPTPIVVVSSRGKASEVELSLSAMRAGALMVLPTPDGPQSPNFADQCSHLRSMVKAMAQVKVVRRWSHLSEAVRPVRPLHTRGDLRIAAMAASTGGPPVLQRILSLLPGDFAAPVLIVQHIAPGFVQGLADWLSRSCDVEVKVAGDREPLQGRVAYLAPDHHHLGVDAAGTIRLSRGAPIAGFRPSATHLFRSTAAAYGSAVAAVILTGMGRDGAEGLAEVRSAGGLILAQDQDSSVVFGMPGAAVAAGIVDMVLSPEAIGQRLVAELASKRNR